MTVNIDYSTPFGIRKLPNISKLPWVPAVGTVGVIGLNTLLANDPCPTGNCTYSWSDGGGAIVNNWDSNVFAPLLGPAGSMIATGGGGASYQGTELQAHDFYSRLCGRLDNPVTQLYSYAQTQQQPPLPPDPNFDTVWWEHPGGVPPSGHHYDSYEYLPPSMGGGEMGSFLKYANHLSYGYQSHNAAHRNDLKQRKWYRAANNPIGIHTLSNVWICCVTVENRKKVYGLQCGGNTGFMSQLDFSDGSGVGIWGTVSTLPWWQGTGGTLQYWPTKDRIVFFGESSNNNHSINSKITVIDPSNFAGSPIFPTIVGDDIPALADTHEGGWGICYDPPNACFWVYCPTNNAPPLIAGQPHTDERQNIYRLDPSSNISSPWTMTKVVMPGVTITGERHQGIWKGFMYHPWLRSVCWLMSASLPMYGYRTS